jgi:hypothetical protein
MLVMGTHSLIIHPGDPDYVPNEDFGVFLRDCGFIGQPYTRWYGEYSESGFNPGENFFKHIESEYNHHEIGLIPTPEGYLISELEDRCKSYTIQIESEKVVQIIAGDGANIPPVCPHCAYLITDDEFKQLFEVWFDFRELWRCPACGNQYSAADLDYQKTVALSRYWFDIQSIGYEEAKPSDDFLRLLRLKTSQDWRYMWLYT